jgi:hypothetical protein
MSLVRGAADSPEDVLSQRPAEVVSMREGKLSLWAALAPTMLVTRVDGVLTEVGAEAIVLGMLRVLDAHGSLLVLNDWESMIDYSPSVGARITAATWTAGDAFEGAHFLMPVRRGVFGLQAASAVLRRVTVHPTRAAFDRRLADEMLTRRIATRSGVRPAQAPTRGTRGTPTGG